MGLGPPGLELLSSSTLQWFLCGIIVVHLLITGYVKMYHEFMSLQPVFHTYDLHRWIMRDHIINPLPPAKNKFCDFHNVTVRILGKMVTRDELADAVPLNEFADLIDSQYLSVEGGEYAVKPRHIAAHLVGHKHEAFVTWYGDGEDGPIVGTMTSRPMFVTIRGSRHLTMYTDHLCVHRGHRGRNVAAKMIQTTVYVQRHDRPQYTIAMFKREGARTAGVVPVVTYDTTMHRIHMTSRDVPELPRRTRVFRIPAVASEKASNSVVQGAYVDFMEFVNAARNRFAVFAIPYKTNVWELIAGGILIPFLVYDESVVPPKVVAAYVYKNSSVSHGGVAYVELAASIANTATRAAKANHATYFAHTMNAMRDEFGGLFVEAASDTVHLTSFIRHTSELSLQSTQTTEFVMFNYAARPVGGGDVLMIGV
jgi:hypothetical protein